MSGKVCRCLGQSDNAGAKTKMSKKFFRVRGVVNLLTSRMARSCWQLAKGGRSGQKIMGTLFQEGHQLVSHVGKGLGL